MNSACIIDLLVTVNNIKILIVVKKFFNGGFISSAARERPLAFVSQVPDIFVFNQIWSSSIDFRNISQHQISWKSVQQGPG